MDETSKNYVPFPTDIDWSSENFAVGDPRVVVGYDYRRSNSSLCTASIDAEIWSRPSILEDGFYYVKCSVGHHGLNMAFSEEAFFEEGSPCQRVDMEGSVLVAFDAPEAYIEIIKRSFAIDPLPLAVVSKSKAWTFWGYDVCDWDLTRSAIHNYYDLNHRKIFSAEFPDFAGYLNPHGLFDDELTAIKLAIGFDRRLDEVAPFCPCGVWVKNKK